VALRQRAHAAAAWRALPALRKRAALHLSAFATALLRPRLRALLLAADGPAAGLAVPCLRAVGVPTPPAPPGAGAGGAAAGSVLPAWLPLAWAEAADRRAGVGADAPGPAARLQSWAAAAAEAEWANGHCAATEHAVFQALFRARPRARLPSVAALPDSLARVRV
jgi:hypothetical protein